MKLDIWSHTYKVWKWHAIFPKLKMHVPNHSLIPQFCFSKHIKILLPEVESYLEGFMWCAKYYAQNVCIQEKSGKILLNIKKCGYHYLQKQ